MLKPCLNSGISEAGCDEAGRGCLAGPVFAAAVLLAPGFTHPELTDSKKLSEKARNKLRMIIESEALSFGVALASPEEIDSMNILNASILAMQRAVAKLKPPPEHLLIDGNRFKPYKDIPHTTVVKGDSIYLPIAAASILAKTHRDEFMKKIHLEFPGFNWERNKGYPTAEHRSAILELGPTPHHRKSFALLPRQMKLEFN